VSSLNPHVCCKIERQTLVTKRLRFLVFSPKLVLLQNTNMKVMNSAHVSSFGGLNFVVEELEKQDMADVLASHLPKLPPQSMYSWKDILYSFWSIYLCGGDCIEDISTNLKGHIGNNPFYKVPSPDRILGRFKQLAIAKSILKSPRGTAKHEFGINQQLNQLNVKILKKLKALEGSELTLDYDNTIIFTDKADSANTYKKAHGYQPGVGIMGNNIVYVENRNGNSNPRTLQEKTLCRMFSILEDNKIRAKNFRADSGSYLFEVIKMVEAKTDNFYIKARMSEVVAKAISNISAWERVETFKEIVYRGEIEYTPFARTQRDSKEKKTLNTYRLIVTKVERKDKQINAFTNEPYLYSAIATNDMEKNADQIVDFYNQRGTAEKEFDILKNDFGWNNLPFSRLEQNTVFMVFTAICRNLYGFIIKLFSKRTKGLKPSFRIKKFIFRFICIPAKWVKHARQWHLKLYGNVAFKT